MADPVVAELNERFGTANTELSPDVIYELQSIMRLHELDVQDMFFKWESYCIKMDMDQPKMSMSTVRKFKQDLQDTLERANRAQALEQVKTEKRPGGTPRPGARNNSDVFGMLDGLTTPAARRAAKLGSARKTPMGTPIGSRLKNEPVSSPMKLEAQLDAMGVIPPSSFKDRQNAGEVIEILNENLPAPEPPIAPFGESRIKLTAASDLKKLGYKPLAMKLSEASEILDDRIDDFTSLILEHYKLDESVFGSAAMQSTTEIVAVGRVASDTSEGKLNAASLVLETSRKLGGGFRVPLNVSKLKGYQFFPGQIVALRGTNTTGREFTVNEVIRMPLMGNAASTLETMTAHRERLRGGPDAMDTDDENPMPLNVIFASGPYTADDNLDFEPLHTLINEAADTYADAVILTGPFIDAEHPLIASGDFDLPEEAVYDPDAATMSTVFKYLISPALNRLVSANPHVTILLVPSVRDVIDRHVSWPQDAFPPKELGLHKSIKILGNPMTLSLNETLVGISSQDALWELKHEELIGGTVEDTNGLSRVARYLIEQRHYFPLFPPTDRTKLPKTGRQVIDGQAAPGAMLDISYLKLGEMVNVRPDVLIVPSALPPFAKVIESVLVINPGYLSQRKRAGTYARMTLYPPKLSEADAAPGGMLAHRIFERARVEVTRI
ncbi:DNA polymerase alpha subunit B N-terminal-domain-containing protein [Neurospora hispaniola]|uniref:DNA polymerase alpha subunit B n=1 Tax=Neurospora hispaniola TaxID=588809 RepID=A0AAJ0IFY4_9PEZI|nr:DNA polymerase alpha subunit B N-terminal-domain-containing protein [Neurospora hispaniola]